MCTGTVFKIVTLYKHLIIEDINHYVQKQERKMRKGVLKASMNIKEDKCLAIFLILIKRGGRGQNKINYDLA